MRTIKTVLVALVALAAIDPSARAQGNLPVALFERYVEALRLQSGIPGMSVTIIQNGHVVWEAGLGFQDVEAQQRPTPDTPYPVFGLTQALSSTVVLQQCLEQRYLKLTDRVQKWNPEFEDPTITVAQLMSHTSSAGAFKYDP